MSTGRFGQRAFQALGGDVGSAAAARVGCGLAQPVHHPRVADRGRRQQVHGHLLRSGTFLVEHLRRAFVPALSHRRGQILVDGRSHQRMDEPQRPLAFD